MLGFEECRRTTEKARIYQYPPANYADYPLQELGPTPVQHEHCTQPNCSPGMDISFDTWGPASGPFADLPESEWLFNIEPEKQEEIYEPIYLQDFSQEQVLLPPVEQMINQTFQGEEGWPNVFLREQGQSLQGDGCCSLAPVCETPPEQIPTNAQLHSVFETAMGTQKGGLSVLLYLYSPLHDSAWHTWWQTTPGYMGCLTREASGNRAMVYWGDKAKQKKRTGKVWEHFLQCADINGAPLVMCRYCHQTLTHPDGNTKNSTTGPMTHHLERNRKCPGFGVGKKRFYR